MVWSTSISKCGCLELDLVLRSNLITIPIWDREWEIISRVLFFHNNVKHVRWALDISSIDRWRLWISNWIWVSTLGFYLRCWITLCMASLILISTPYSASITLLKFIIVLCGTDNIQQNIPHIQSEFGKYSIEYCQSRTTLLWISIMLWG